MTWKLVFQISLLTVVFTLCVITLMLFSDGRTDEGMAILGGLGAGGMFVLLGLGLGWMMKQDM